MTFPVPHTFTHAPYETVDPGNAGAITIERYGQIVELTSTAAETRTLATPTRPGMLAIIRVKTYVGAITLTASGGLNNNGDTVATFLGEGHQLVLISVSEGAGYRWDVIGNEGGVVVA